MIIPPYLIHRTNNLGFIATQVKHFYRLTVFEMSHFVIFPDINASYIIFISKVHMNRQLNVKFLIVRYI